MGKAIGLIGVPSSAGAFAPGQEKAPQAIRNAVFVQAVAAAGMRLVDYGDSAVWRWRPDRDHPFAQNLDAVVSTVQLTALRVREVLGEGNLPLVIGGDCTIELGTVAGHLPGDERIGLLYFDLHPDLNVPGSPRDAALDWTGMAHMLGEAGTADALSHAGPRFPLLTPEAVQLFSYGPEQATAREREAIQRLGIEAIPVGEVAADPEGAARAALTSIEARCDRLLVHFDVDTIDFTSMPLSENTGRNIGLSFDTAFRALAVLLTSPKLSALTITELNPDHGEPDGSTVHAFVDALIPALAGMAVLRN